MNTIRFGRLSTSSINNAERYGNSFKSTSREHVRHDPGGPRWCGGQAADLHDPGRHRRGLWRKPRTVHDPGKALLDVALAVALGGDCLADVAMLRCGPAIFGPVASDPTLSRLIDTLAASGEKALQAIRSARSEVRERVWTLAGRHARRPGDRALRQGGCGRYLEEDLRPPPADGLCRSRIGRNRRARRCLPPAGERRVQHRCQPHRHRPTGSGRTTEEVPARALDPHPHGLRRRHPRLRVLAHAARPMAVLFARHDGHRSDPRTPAEGPRPGLDAGRRDQR
jgi:hypothetical protein